MTVNLYVGNLPYTVSESDLTTLFAGFGRVDGVRIIHDSVSGRPKGYAFVAMATKADADKAAHRLNGKDFRGRKLKVSEARRKKDQSAPSARRQPLRQARPQVRFPSDWSTWRKQRP
ncbi:MAG: RNA-binding protein [Desulfobacterales bacterium]|nr:RNA-binding protein [Desulfobacterales bacterium]